MDGTLLDTRPSISLCLNEALNFYGVPKVDLHEYASYFGGSLRRELSKGFKAHNIPEELAEKILLRYMHNYIGYGHKEAAVYPGIYELIDFLKNKGIAACVLTNNTQQVADVLIKHFFESSLFRFVWGENDAQCLKPHPDMGIRACSKLSLPPESIIYVGDDSVDILFAKAVGMLPAGACWGFRGEKELKDAGAEVLLATPDDLCKIIHHRGKSVRME